MYVECQNQFQLIYKKNLKILKGQSESIYQRRTDNTMAKRKSTKGQTMLFVTTFLQHLHMYYISLS
jgi:hypothetical protein